MAGFVKRTKHQLTDVNEKDGKDERNLGLSSFPNCRRAAFLKLFSRGQRFSLFGERGLCGGQTRDRHTKRRAN